MSKEKRSITKEILREILSSYVKAGYEPSDECIDSLGKHNEDELTSKGIYNLYLEILEDFEANGTTDNDPGPLPIIG